MEYHSDYQNLLFSKSEILSILEDAGFPLACKTDLANAEVAKTPGWMKLYAAKSALRTYEAAWIMSGEKPPTTYPNYYDVELQEQLRYLHVIEDLAGAGEISTKPSEWHRDDDAGTWLLDHQSILKWCRRTGYDWPLESLMQTKKESEEIALHPRREVTYQRIIASLLAMHYSSNELKEPYRLADQLLDDFQKHAIKAPASRNTLGPIFEELPPVQKAPLD